MPDKDISKHEEPEIMEELRDLVVRGQAGDPTVLSEVREFLDANPDAVEQVGNLTNLSEAMWIAMFAPKNPIAKEAIKRKADQMRADLLGSSSSTMDKLLVDQIVASWLEVNHARCDAAQQRGSIRQGSLRMRRLASAQRNHLAAIKSLHLIRSLLPLHADPAGTLRCFEPDKRRTTG